MKASVALWAALLAVTCQPITLWGQELRCGLTTMAPTGTPIIVGPEDVTSRLHIVNQPESPIEIVAVDFTGTQLLIEEGSISRSYTFRQSALLDVRNRSNQPIERIDMGLLASVCQNTGPRPRQAWSGTLMPGETTQIRLGGGSGSGSGTGGSTMSPLLVWLWVDRVDVGECTYRPAQVIPRALCDDGRPRIPVTPR